MLQNVADLRGKDHRVNLVARSLGQERAATLSCARMGESGAFILQQVVSEALCNHCKYCFLKNSVEEPKAGRVRVIATAKIDCTGDDLGFLA